jgi:hypothetical protein
VSQDLYGIGFADAEEDAANLNAPVGESMEAIDGGEAQFFHHCP